MKTICNHNNRIGHTEYTFGGKWKYDQEQCVDCGQKFRKFKKRGEFQPYPANQAKPKEVKTLWQPTSTSNVKAKKDSAVVAGCLPD